MYRFGTIVPLLATLHERRGAPSDTPGRMKGAGETRG